ncbi:aurora like protein kinase [Volvox carteri f. nagariensis]|uniref:Aurora like protein kinase n=1 Tax=Volvox carteri f. nagariensis TaxID=3068 RepID=D8TL04_VOLCA|nr:aurora like protein kinase [Volvox carteri f. nagariensis]EFJ51649.1 aurora like protein kinase [Volvox carteri f. nagariensis]|eukprot:XP_002947059.1 aurora like protein kinase [Volvox carteri f. nagariensis]
MLEGRTMAASHRLQLILQICTFSGQTTASTSRRDQNNVQYVHRQTSHRLWLAAANGRTNSKLASLTNTLGSGQSVTLARRHVEQFELHKELYRGKTSLLYMATDKISGVQVALKLYRKRKLSVLNRYQVEREVRLHINLHHENIIHLFAAFEDEKHVYMVQEFAVCGDLFEDLKKGGGQLKEKYAVRDVIVPFLSALAYLHNQGIIHRDIKPENILLGPNKAIKVADFGLSININHERPVTRAGTLDYMAPEVLVCPDKRRPEENKDKVDSWAVGILAYELLVGYPPFEQESRAATYEHIMYKEPKFPSWMAEDAKKFIGLALCKNASQRPTVFELMQHSWVQPYMMRHLQPTQVSTSTPGPSRLRNSVSHTNGDTGPRDPATSTSTNGMLVPHSQHHVSISASGMVAAGSTGAASSGMGMSMGTGGRLFMPVPAPPASALSATTLSAQQQSTADSGAFRQGAPHGNISHSQLQAQSHLHSQQQHQQQPPQSGSAARPQALSPNMALKQSVSLHEKPSQGSQDATITGSGAEVGRIHDSISDPSARAFESSIPQPPGVTSSASLYSGGSGAASAGGAGNRGGANNGPTDMDRSPSQSQNPSMGSNASASSSGAARSLQIHSVSA